MALTLCNCAATPPPVPAKAAVESVTAAPSTFSIVAFDPANGDLGVAVQSKFFAVGTVVPWLQAGVGAIATQSYANTTYGPRGLAMLRSGKSATDVVRELTANDSDRARRQLGIVDHLGRVAHFTGTRCHAWAGAKQGEYYTVQGNLLVSQATTDAMADAFEVARGELGERLVAALEAGQAAGGDARGRQSAALVVVREQGGYAELNDRYLDLRVDDHPRPIVELRRLLDLALNKDAMSRVGRLFRDGKPDAALPLLRITLEQHSERPSLQLQGARWLFLAGQRAEAEDLVQRVVARYPKDADVLFQSAHAYAFGSLTDSCLATLQKLLEVSPNYRELIQRERQTPPWVSLGEPLKQLLSR